ncbi:MAG: hypothetical protein SangKO_038540 [Sandaracinaceae bacterium]|nr:MAG: DUF3618 domain-containing protein [Sandaracinaceae bacterium]
MNENDDKDIQALRANIVATRERLAAEVGEVGDRLTPEHAKEVAKEKMLEAKDRAIESTKEATEQVAASAASAGRTLADTVRENPIPSAMVAVGAGWLLYKAFGPERRVERAAESAASSARAAMSDGADAARARMDRASDKAAVVKDRVTARATELADESRLQAQRAWVQTQDTYDAQPLAFGAAALVAGVGLGMLIPTTTRERRLMGERREQALERAKELGSEAREVAVASAREAAERAKETAKREASRKDLPGGNGMSSSNGRSLS